MISLQTLFCSAIVLLDQRVAGKHLKRLKNASDLSSFGLTLGDLFDISEALSGIRHEKETRNDTPASSNNISSSSVNVNQVEQKTTAKASTNVEKPTNQNPAPKHTDSPPPIEPRVGLAAQSITLENSSSTSDSESDDGIKSDDEVFKGFANKHEVHDMSQYERLNSKNKILNYHRLIEAKFPAKKPIIVFGGSSKTSKRKSSDTDDSNKPKKSRKAGKDEKHKSQNKTKTKTKTAPKHPIEKHLRAYQNFNTMTKTDQAEITQYLENPLNRRFSIPDLLEVNDDPTIDEIAQTLKSNGSVFGKSLSKLLEYLMDHLYELAGDPSSVTSELRESMAVSLVACYPKYAQPMVADCKPWSWLFNRKLNTGKLANIVAHRQTKQKVRLRGGGRKDKKKRPSEAVVAEIIPKLPAVNEMQLSKEARYFRSLMALDNNRHEVEAGYRLTFEERRKIIMSQEYTNAALLEAWPHLKSFQGAIIDLEFELMHPECKNNLIKNFQDIVLPLLKLGKDAEKHKTVSLYGDVTLQAMIVLSEFLPRPKRCYAYERSMDTIPLLKNFMHFVPVGSNVQYEINEKRSNSKHPVQPYLLAIGTERKIESLILVLGDSHSVQLPQGVQVLKAVDLLVKAHYVLNTNYVLGWKNVYRFLEANLYKLKPPGKLSQFTAEYMELKDMDCNG